MDAVEHGKMVLAGLIADRHLLRLERAAAQLVPEHFVDHVQRTMWQILLRYQELTGGMMTRQALADSLRGQTDTGKVALYTETFDALAATAVEEHEFRWSVEQLKELAADRETAAALAEGMEILRKGVEEKGETVKGHVAARTRVLERFATTDRELAMQQAPEGNTRNERDEMLADYAERKRLHSSGLNQGVMFGIPSLDARVGGLQPGELDLLVGYSSDGKTSMGVQLSWNAATMQGLNVLVMTTETLRPQFRRKLLARHSMHPQFELPDGLNSRDLKNGTLTAAEERMLPVILDDYARNPAYGQIYVAQVPRGSTIDQVETRARRIGRQDMNGKVDLILIDYLRLLRSARFRNSDREELGSIVVEGKGLATTWDDGKGVPVVSPWQVNRTSRDEAERVGYYTSKALAETAETTNTADVIVSLLAPADNENRRCEVKMQILKNRDGETANSIPINVDYATSTFTDGGQSTADLDHLVNGTSGSEFAGLLTA